MSRSVTAVIPHYFEKRRANLGVLILALQRSSIPVDEIIIWNNSPGPLSAIGAQVVDSPRNEGARARFIAALMAKSEYVFFQDNDLRVEHDTIRGLVRQLEQLSNSVVSLDGRVLGEGGSYHKSVLLGRAVTEPRVVDITLGHAEMIPTRLLPTALSSFPFSEAPEMDDIFFSWSCAQADIRLWVVPGKSGGSFVHLQEFEVGACKEKKHYAKRDVLCRRLFGPTHDECAKH